MAIAKRVVRCAAEMASLVIEDDKGRFWEYQKDKDHGGRDFFAFVHTTTDGSVVDLIPGDDGQAKFRQEEEGLPPIFRVDAAPRPLDVLAPFSHYTQYHLVGEVPNPLTT